MSESYGAVSVATGFKDQCWDILGQTYTPLHVKESSFSFHMVFPPGTHVPTHHHTTQEEFVYVLEGVMTCVLDGETCEAGPGTMLTIPRLVPHSLHNHTDQPVKAVGMVSPTGKLYEYFQQLNNLRDEEKIERLAANHEVPFGAPANQP